MNKAGQGALLLTKQTLDINTIVASPPMQLSRSLSCALTRRPHEGHDDVICDVINVHLLLDYRDYPIRIVSQISCAAMSNVR